MRFIRPIQIFKTSLRPFFNFHDYRVPLCLSNLSYTWILKKETLKSSTDFRKIFRGAITEKGEIRICAYSIRLAIGNIAKKDIEESHDDGDDDVEYANDEDEEKNDEDEVKLVFALFIICSAGGTALLVHGLPLSVPPTLSP